MGSIKLTEARYGWYFGRDGEWSGFALLDYGDFQKVKSELEFYGKYQDLSGKIFHEATTSGLFIMMLQMPHLFI